MPRRWFNGCSRELVVTAFRDWFGIQANQAEVLVTLFELNGRPVAVRQVGQLVNTHRPIRPAAVMERVSCLRSAMVEEAIDTSSLGYALTESGLAECRLAISQMAEVLAREAALEVPLPGAAHGPDGVEHEEDEAT